MEIGTYVAVGVLMAVFVFTVCIMLIAIRILYTLRPQQIEVEPPAVVMSPRGIQCYVCMERVATAMLVDCGHAGLCMECGKKLLATHRGCPLCRAPITRVMQVDIVEIP